MLTSYRYKTPRSLTLTRHGVVRVEMISHFDIIPLPAGQEPSQSDAARQIADMLDLPLNTDPIAFAVQLHESDIDRSIARAYNQAQQRAEDYFWHLELQKPEDERTPGVPPGGMSRALEACFTEEETFRP